VNTLTYDNSITALLVIDPYNDFISEGGKVWDRLKAVAEANGCVPNMLEILTAERKAGLRVSMYPTAGTAPETTRLGSTSHRSKRPRGRERPSSTGHGAASFAANSSLDLARS
jgi:nicotinamidase-related amidase